MRRSHVSHAPRAARAAIVSVILLIAVSLPARGQSKVGGHFGVVSPVVQLAADEVTTFADGLGLGFPTGLTLAVMPGVDFDLEVVPYIQDNEVTNVLLHPGALMALTNGYTFGIRAAFETGGAYGVTVLLNKGKRISPDVTLFAELVVPVRFFREAPDFPGEETDVRKAIVGALHVGIAF
jgi:hypothetical protein